MADRRAAGLPANHSFPPEVIARIHEMADTGQYPIRGLGARRKVPTFDDLVFLTASVSRYPLEGYRERCETTDRARDAPRRQTARARDPHHHRRDELRRAVGHGQGGPRARRHRGRDVDHDGRRRHDPRGAQGLDAARLPGAAVALRLRPRRPPPGRRHRDRRRPGRQAGRRRACCSARRSTPGWRPCARCRPASTSARPAATPTGSAPTTCGSRSRSCARPPNWAIPVYVKVGATRVDHDVKLAVAAGADVVVVDGMQGGTAATQDVFIEHAGIPTLPAVRHGGRGAGRDRAWTARCSSSSPAGSAPAPTWPRPSPSGPTPCRSGWPPCSPSAATAPSTATPPVDAVDVAADYAALGTAPGHCAHCHTGPLPGRHHHPGPRARGAGWIPTAAADGGGQLPAGHSPWR